MAQDLWHHLHAGLQEHAAHGAVVHAKLLGNRAHGPVLSVMQAHDLGFEGARDHRARLSSRAAAQRPQLCKCRERPSTETAARFTARSNRWALTILYPPCALKRRSQHCGSQGATRGTVMRHPGLASDSVTVQFAFQCEEKAQSGIGLHRSPGSAAALGLNRTRLRKFRASRACTQWNFRAQVDFEQRVCGA